jgi:CDP-diacylglycerol pyrophosphatase
LPTEKISGIEDERLLKDDTPNYFYLAWQSRSLLTEKLNGGFKSEVQHPGFQ